MRLILAGDRRLGWVRQKPKPTPEQLELMKEARLHMEEYCLDLCKRFQAKYGKIDLVISGGASGIDNIADEYVAKRLTGKACKVIEANWFEYKKKAGMMRNEQMAKMADAAIIVAMPDSNGSWHMNKVARSMGLKVKLDVIEWPYLDFMFPGIEECYLKDQTPTP